MVLSLGVYRSPATAAGADGSPKVRMLSGRIRASIIPALAKKTGLHLEAGQAAQGEMERDDGRRGAGHNHQPERHDQRPGEIDTVSPACQA